MNPSKFLFSLLVVIGLCGSTAIAQVNTCGTGANTYSVNLGNTNRNSIHWSGGTSKLQCSVVGGMNANCNVSTSSDTYTNCTGAYCRNVKVSWMSASGPNPACTFACTRPNMGGAGCTLQVTAEHGLPVELMEFSIAAMIETDSPETVSEK